jgi:ElaB/YqjD/DUF883 family membrane-anchored ribosome-binding protein
MLPPDDEIAHLAYSMGYLALLTRSTPAVMAAERAKMAALLQRLTDEMTGTLKTTADYHQKLNDRLTALPVEITQGVNPTALAAQLVAGVREQFLKCGIPEAGALLKEQGEIFRQQADAHAHKLMEVQEKLYACQSRVTFVLNHVESSADSAKKSIDQWNRKMQKVQWVQIGSAWLIGLLLGALMYWWVVPPPRSPAQLPSVNPPKQHAAAASGRKSQQAPKSPRGGRFAGPAKTKDTLH